MKSALTYIILFNLLLNGIAHSQYSYLQLAIQGNKEQNDHVQNNEIRKIIAVNYKPRKGKLIRIKTKFEKEYDLNGNLISLKEYWRKRGRNWSHETRLYDSNDYLLKRSIVNNYISGYVEIEKLRYNENQTQVWIDTERGSKKYKSNFSSSMLLNKRKQIIAEIRSSKDTSFIHYNENGKFIAKSLSPINFKQECFYGDNGYLIESNYFENVKYNYNFDPLGNIIEFEEYLQNPEGEYILKYAQSSKFLDGRIIEIKHLGKDKKQEKKIEYVYKGDILDHKKYYNSKNRLMIVEKYEYIYLNE